MYLRSFDIPDDIKEQVLIQDLLFGKEIELRPEFLGIEDLDSLALAISKYLLIRPHNIAKIMDLIVFICGNHPRSPDFREKLFYQCEKHCKALIYRCNTKGIYSVYELKNRIKDNSMYHYPFMRIFPEIHNDLLGRFANTHFNYDLINNSIKSEEYFEHLIDYGWPKSTYGFAIKFDDLDLLKQLSSSPTFKPFQIEWSVFEVGYNPKNHEMTTIAAFFGSLNVFRYMVLNKFPLNDCGFEMSLLSGCYLITSFYENPKISDVSLQISSMSLREESFDWISNYVDIQTISCAQLYNHFNMRALSLYLLKGNDIMSYSNWYKMLFLAITQFLKP